MTNFNLAKEFVARKRRDNHESLSGPGSHVSNTTEVVTVLDKFILENNIASILDLGCGDWNWFKNIDKQSATYEGWDACPQMISDNFKYYGCKSVAFNTKDIVTETYPTVDLIICRDVLFHMTTDISIKVIDKIKSSCKYFLCTSFNDVKQNKPHGAGWGFYKINTNISPFDLNQYILFSEIESRNTHTGSPRYINIYKFK